MSWPRVPLKELLKPISRPEPVQAERTYRLLGAHWYASGLYVKETCPGSEIRAARLYRVEEGDFVYNRLFAWKGSFAVATDEATGCYVSNEFPCFAVDRNRLEAAFLWRYFSREQTWNEALGLSTGGTPTSRNRLKEERLLAMTIPLPLLDEQRRIVAKLQAVAERLKRAQQLNRDVSALRGALCVSLHIEVSGDRIVSLGEILELDERAERVVPDGAYPQVGIRGFGKGMFAKPAVRGSETTYKVFNRLYRGALVLSQVKGWEGAIAVCPEAFEGNFASPEYRTFRCQDSAVLPAYLSEIIRTPWFLARLSNLSRGVGARRERTRPEQFLSLRIPMPRIGDQAGLLSVLLRLRRATEIGETIAGKTSLILAGIVSRAFNGPDA